MARNCKPPFPEEDALKKIESAWKCSPGHTEASPEPVPPVSSYEEAILEDHAFVNLDIREKEIFLKPWVAERSIVLVTGWRGIGKTWFLLGVFDAITRGENFGPWKCEEVANCLLLDGEMAAADVKNRLLEVGTTGRKSKLLIYSDAYATSLGLRRASLLDEKWREGFLEFLKAKEIRCLGLDNIASLAPGIDENSKQAWDPINQWLLRLRFAGITTVLLHHEGKGGAQRGTSGREDNIDISITLKKPADYLPEHGARFIVGFSKSRVPIASLPLITDVEFKLSRSIGDVLEWHWKSVELDRKDEVLRMLDRGLSQKDAGAALGITQSWVSRIKAQAIRDGLMTSKGKLTQFGFSSIGESF